MQGASSAGVFAAVSDMQLAVIEDPLSNVLANIEQRARAESERNKLAQQARDSSVQSWKLCERRNTHDPPGVQRIPGGVASQINILQWVAPAKEMAKHFMENASGKLKQKLDEVWKEFHQAPAETLVDIPAPKDNRALCFFARMHVCHKPQLRLFVTLLQSTIRRACRKKDGPARSGVLQGILVIRVHRSDRTDGESWLHTSYQNLTTWRATLLPLVRDDDELRKATARGCDATALIMVDAELECGAMTWWQALHSTDFQWRWTVSIHEICKASRIIPHDFCLKHVIVDTDPIVSSEFWQGAAVHKEEARKRFARRQAKKNKATAAAARAPRGDPAVVIALALADGDGSPHDAEGEAEGEADADWDPSADEDGGDIVALVHEDVVPPPCAAPDIDIDDEEEADPMQIEDEILMIMEEKAGLHTNRWTNEDEYFAMYGTDDEDEN